MFQKIVKISLAVRKWQINFMEIIEICQTKINVRKLIFLEILENWGNFFKIVEIPL